MLIGSIKKTCKNIVGNNKRSIDNLQRRLISILPITDTLSQDSTIGLEMNKIRMISDIFHLENINGSYNRSLAEFQTILWFGSCFADLLFSDSDKNENKDAYTTTLTQAALFNLAVSLIDSIVDNNNQIQLTKFKEEINKEVIISLLKEKNINLSPNKYNDDKFLSVLVTLIKHILVSIGISFKDRKDLTMEITGMIWDMYKSELKLHDYKKLDAKFLPILFISKLRILDPEKQPHYDNFFKSISEFFYIYDDWVDLVDDIFDGNNNSIIKSTSVPLNMIKLLTSSKLKINTENRLSELLKDSMKTAFSIDIEVGNKTILLYKNIFSKNSAVDLNTSQK